MICQWFSLVMQITLRVTKKIVIHGNSCIILYILLTMCAHRLPLQCIAWGYWISIFPIMNDYHLMTECYDIFLLGEVYLHVLILCNSPLYSEGKYSFIGKNIKPTLCIYIIGSWLRWYCNIHWNMICNQMLIFRPSNHIYIIMERQNVITGYNFKI